MAAGLSVIPIEITPEREAADAELRRRLAEGVTLRPAPTQEPRLTDFEQLRNRVEELAELAEQMHARLAALEEHR